LHLANEKNKRLLKDGKLLPNVGETYTTTLQAGSYQFEWK
jgi:hypothetical protein